MKASELLRKGSAEIDRRGWTRDYFGSDPLRFDTCSVGAIGALRAAISGDPFVANITDPVFGTAREFLLAAIGSKSVVNWNDDPERTEEEVLAMFESAALLAEVEER